MPSCAAIGYTSNDVYRPPGDQNGRSTFPAHRVWFVRAYTPMRTPVDSVPVCGARGTALTPHRGRPLPYSGDRPRRSVLGLLDPVAALFLIVVGLWGFDELLQQRNEVFFTHG